MEYECLYTNANDRKSFAQTRIPEYEYPERQSKNESLSHLYEYPSLKNYSAGIAMGKEDTGVMMHDGEYFSLRRRSWNNDEDDLSGYTSLLKNMRKEWKIVFVR